MLLRPTLLALALASFLPGAGLPRIQVSPNHRFLVTEDGRPFFYLADTGWELFHRLNREQAVEYLNVRAAQRFNVIQAVALAEEEGIVAPNAYGKLPLIDGDPARPALAPGQYDYWEHVDYIVDQANARGLYIAMLPSWGSWVTETKQINPTNAQAFGEFLSRRYGQKGIIWVLGGDRPATGFEETWRALARGIAAHSSAPMTYHPQGHETSSTWFHNDSWLSFNMQQDGHGLPGPSRSWEKIAADYNRTPTKPVLDGEPLYEDHPLAFDAPKLGYSFDAHVRQYAYWDTFSGACGHTYGNHAVWQMYAPTHARINGPLMHWNEAIHRPGASQMQYLRALLESRPYLSRVPDQSLVVNALEGADHIAATRGDGYAFIYSAQGRPFTVRLGRISGAKLRASWYNPRTGGAESLGEFDNTGERQFTPPSQGFGSDWVLILDAIK